MFVYVYVCVFFFYLFIDKRIVFIGKHTHVLCVVSVLPKYFVFLGDPSDSLPLT